MSGSVNPFGDNGETSMKRAPTYGAVPSADDLKKNKEHQGQVKEKREDLRFANLQSLLQREALDRLTKLELENPKKAKEMEDMLLSMAREGHFKEEQYDEEGRALNPVSDAKLLELIAQQAASLQAEKAALIPKRFGDDSDSDIDLDGL